MRPATPEEQAQYARNPYTGYSWEDDPIIPDTTEPDNPDTAQPQPEPEQTP